MSVLVRGVNCPKCGFLVGFQFKDPKLEGIKKIQFKVGDTEYPSIDMESLPAERPVFCPHCGYKFNLARAQEGT